MNFPFMKKESKVRLHLRTILTLAEQLETKAQAMYHSLKEKTVDPEIREVCGVLANEEQRHAENLAVILDHWKSIPASEQDPRTFSFEALKLTDEFFSEPPPQGSTRELLTYALGQENKSIAMYEYFQERLNEEFTRINKRYDSWSETRLEWKLSKLDEMIEEERRHKKIIEAFIEKSL